MKIICDQDRICDVEDSIRYWNQTTDHIEDFLTKLKWVKISFFNHILLDFTLDLHATQ